MTNLTELTVQQLYEVNEPMRYKLDRSLPLTADEQELHSCICSEVLARLGALRQSDRDERDAILAECYTEEQATPAPHCILCKKPAPYADARSQNDGTTEPVPPMCDDCIREQIEFEKMAEAEYLAQEDIEHTRNGYGAA